MDPGEMPDELKEMSVVEQQLICRLSPAIHVHMLGHVGIAANGHCVTFPQNVNEPAKILPKLPTDIDVLRVTRKGKNNTSKDFRCRRHKIQNALEWLKQHNPAYSDIIISEANLSVLPADGELIVNCLNVDSENISEHSDKGPAPLQTCVNETDAGVSDSCVLLNDPPVNIQEEISNTIQSLTGDEEENLETVINHKKKEARIPWPTRANEPISEFTTRIFFTLSFPTLFPRQQGDFHINRPRTCTSLSDWADHLMWYKDGRFAKHQYFKFIVHNMIMRKRALELSSFIVKQKLGEEHFSIDEIREKIRGGDTTIVDKLLYFSASLRGTSQYWNQRSKELRALVQYQINEGNGLPSFFTTGSCAEYHFKPLRNLLQNYIGLTTGESPDLSDRSVMFKVLQQHTHVIAQYFDLRTQAYFKEVMKPVFGVNAFWYRREFAKSRGMIHWHGLCWRSDKEPHVLLSDAMCAGMNPEDRANKLSGWAKAELGMTASHPAGKNVEGEPRKEFWPPPEGTAQVPPEDKNPLIKLLMDVSQSQESLLEDHLLLTNRINIHRCSDYCLCLPRNSRHGEKVCRMEFGSEKHPGKAVRDELSIVLDRNRNERLEMSRDHPFLVQHSKYHTQGWRANGDISIILSKNGPDNPSVDEIIATENYITGYACKGNEGTSALNDLFNDTINSSENSTVKSVCTSLLMNAVKRDVSSTEAAFELSSIPLYRSSHQFQSVSITGARMLERNGFTLTKQSPLDKYLQRPQGDTSSFYQFISKSGKVPVPSGGPIYATWPLIEDYSRTMLLLHWPNWRKVSDIVGECDKYSWVDVLHNFLVTDQCPNFLKADIERARLRITNDQAEENTVESAETRGEDQPEWMDLIAPDGLVGSDIEANEIDFDDGGPCYDWTKTSEAYPDNANTFIDSVTKETCEEATLDIPDVDLGNLNPEQKFAYKIVWKI
ncbi:hypothetical protein FSP39_023709 [Pinctada imbricata]|uniref:Helitron helicase-like domain-containing protein n=1 Tax=Pinctada imbricata TaxID=66713 RepID=A0AA89BV55_PINIB|nr:hypothetical protein FSP39_023709 [Pinctada imbricata]